MESRFNGHKANLHAYLRKRGAEIDVKNKTVKVDIFLLIPPFGIMKYLRQKIIHLSHLLMR